MLSLLLPITLTLLLLVLYRLYHHLHSLTVDDVTDKHVLITGCDSGFGRELAIQLDSLGFQVHAGCLTSQGREGLVGCGAMRVYELDVTDAESVKRIHDAVLPEVGVKGLWALVNNAGVVGLEAPVELCEVKDFEAAIRVNLYGPLQMTKQFLPLLRQAGGRLVNMSSFAGRLAAVNATYCVSKYALRALNDCLRREIAKFKQGVTVSIIEPGYHKTPLINKSAAMARVKMAFDRCDEDVKTVFGHNPMEQMSKNYSLIERYAAPSIRPVIDAYIHAISSRQPRSRYVVGTWVRRCGILLSVSPDWLADAVLAARRI